MILSERRYHESTSIARIPGGRRNRDIDNNARFSRFVWWRNQISDSVTSTSNRLKVGTGSNACESHAWSGGCHQHGHAAVPRLVLDQSAHLSGLLRLGNMAGTRRTAEETPASQPDLMSRAACTLDVCTRQSNPWSTHLLGAQFASRPDFMPDSLRGITETQNHEAISSTPDPHRTRNVDRWFFVSRTGSNSLSGPDELQQ